MGNQSSISVNGPIYEGLRRYKQDDRSSYQQRAWNWKLPYRLCFDLWNMEANRKWSSDLSYWILFQVSRLDYRSSFGQKTQVARHVRAAYRICKMWRHNPSAPLIGDGKWRVVTSHFEDTFILHGRVAEYTAVESHAIKMKGATATPLFVVQTGIRWKSIFDVGRTITPQVWWFEANGPWLSLSLWTCKIEVTLV